eukprot:8320289-Pyramimonas_sp.AAC.1
MGALDTKPPASHCADGCLEFDLAPPSRRARRSGSRAMGKRGGGSHEGCVAASWKRTPDDGGVKL